MTAVQQAQIREHLLKTSRDASSQASKRRRVEMACLPCRTRKVRCDGAKPKCNTCQRGSHDCLYQHVSEMVNVSREYISRLQRREEATDQDMSSVDPPLQNNSLTTGPPPTTFSQPVIQSTGTRNLSSAYGSTKTFNSDTEKHSQKLPGLGPGNSKQPQGHSLEPSFSLNGIQTSEHRQPRRASFAETISTVVPSESRLDALTLVKTAPMSSDNDSCEGFYGDSSTLAYMQAVQKSIESDSSSTSPFAANNSRLRQNSSAGAGTLQPGVHGLMLPKSLADELIVSYFRHVHLLYPFLHRPTFQVKYERTWSSSMEQDDEWLALLNVVFALGSRFGHHFGHETTTSDTIFDHARNLSSLEQMAKPTCQTLQVLLLQGLYYQFTNRQNENWNAIGLAVRVAMAIGAHINPMPGQYNAILTEVRRRCWHGCIVLDSNLAMNLGRPTSIPDISDVPAPANLDDEYITTYGYAAQPVGAKPKTAFFVQLMTFCAIMKDVQRSLYPHNPRRSVSADGSKISALPLISEAVRLDKALFEWYQAVPSFLKSGEAGENDTFDWIRNVLMSRFLNLRILIHRRFASLCRPLHQFAGEVCVMPVDNALYAISLDLCQSAAVKLVEVVGDNFATGLPGSWWAEMNYIFTAASMLLAVQHTEQGLKLDNIHQKAFDRSLGILHQMREHSSTADKYATILEKARETRSTAQESTVPQSRMRAISDPILENPSSDNSMHLPNLAAGLLVSPPLEPSFLAWSVQEQFHEPWDFLLEDNSMPWN